MPITRYLTLPGPMDLIDASNGKPALDAKGAQAKTSHEDISRALMVDPKIKDTMDACDRFDLRGKLTKPTGTTIELTEAEHTILVEVVKRPTTLTDTAIFSPDVHAFLRAILDAPSEKPGA